MLINAKLLGLAAAGSAAVSYVICAIAVALAPGATTRVFGYLLHVDLSSLSRTLTWSSFVIGLIGFSALVGVLVWLAAVFYDVLIAKLNRSASTAAIQRS